MAMLAGSVSTALYSLADVQKFLQQEAGQLTRDEVISRIQKIILPSFQLTSFPAELSAFRTLIELDLSNNDLTTVPSVIVSQLVCLEKLVLRNNKIRILPPLAFPSLTHLDLSDNAIHELPEKFSVHRLKYEKYMCVVRLRHLNLANNAIHTLPTHWPLLTELQILILAGNRLTALPADIGQLQSLYCLRVESNQLSSLPDTLCNLRQLEELDCSSNCIARLPFELSRLTELISLNADYNQLTGLPELTGLQRLRKLCVMHNALQTVDSIGLPTLRNLQFLQLSHNCLRSISDPVFENLRELISIDVSCNELDSLPAGIQTLPSLSLLDLSGNRLSSVPVGLLDLIRSGRVESLYIDRELIPLIQGRGVQLPPGMDPVAHALEVNAAVPPLPNMADLDAAIDALNRETAATFKDMRITAGSDNDLDYVEQGDF